MCIAEEAPVPCDRHLCCIYLTPLTSGGFLVSFLFFPLSASDSRFYSVSTAAIGPDKPLPLLPPPLLIDLWKAVAFVTRLSRPGRAFICLSSSRPDFFAALGPSLSQTTTFLCFFSLTLCAASLRDGLPLSQRCKFPKNKTVVKIKSRHEKICVKSAVS